MFPHIILGYVPFIQYVPFISSFLQNIPTIGGSGFAMALLSIYTLDFYRRGNPEYK
jgi:hypothetical protein